LTGARPIKLTSPRCPSAWQPNHGRRFTYQRGKTVQTTETTSNFSDASTRQNDENMVITRGNTRVADIYLGEFMRLYTHHAFRESLQRRAPNEQPKPLRTDAWWRDYFGGTERSTRRKFFARSAV
jgi:hypothetical protein